MSGLVASFILNSTKNKKENKKKKREKDIYIYI